MSIFLGAIPNGLNLLMMSIRKYRSSVSTCLAAIEISNCLFSWRVTTSLKLLRYPMPLTLILSKNNTVSSHILWTFQITSYFSWPLSLSSSVCCNIKANKSWKTPDLYNTLYDYYYLPLYSCLEMIFYPGLTII